MNMNNNLYNPRWASPQNKLLSWWYRWYFFTCISFQSCCILSTNSFTVSNDQWSIIARGEMMSSWQELCYVVCIWAQYELLSGCWVTWALAEQVSTLSLSWPAALSPCQCQDTEPGDHNKVISEWMVSVSLQSYSHSSSSAIIIINSTNIIVYTSVLLLASKQLTLTKYFLKLIQWNSAENVKKLPSSLSLLSFSAAVDPGLLEIFWMLEFL